MPTVTSVGLVRELSYNPLIHNMARSIPTFTTPVSVFTDENGDPTFPFQLAMHDGYRALLPNYTALGYSGCIEEFSAFARAVLLARRRTRRSYRFLTGNVNIDVDHPSMDFVLHQYLVLKKSEGEVLASLRLQEGTR